MNGGTTRFSLQGIGWTVIAAVTLLLAALILFWPGPLALTDRIPFSLLFAIPGVVSGYRARETLRTSN